MKNIATPMCLFTKYGSIYPNTLFHRSSCKLHSRCIEYPFVASTIKDGERILDVGSAKADTLWAAYLDLLQNETYVTDYDAASYTFTKAKFYEADCRKLPFENDFFDRILAVSVIEHIGLASPQVSKHDKPIIDIVGDIETLKELRRVLKPGCELVITVPYGVLGGLFGSDTARRYTSKTIIPFFKVLKPIVIDYYEYQAKDYITYFNEGSREHVRRDSYIPADDFPDMHGTVTWRRVPVESAMARNEVITDGVLCCVLVK